MSRQFRLRTTGVVLAALFVAGPLVANGTAQAELVESGNDLVFSGGGRNMLGLSCVAEPRSDSVTVEAGSTLRVVNATGHDADLRLDGVSKGRIADEAATEVLFRRGPVEVTLKPDCMLGNPSEPVTVTVTPGPGPSGPTPAPNTDPPSTPAGTPSTVTSGPTTTSTPPRTTKPHSARPAITPPRRPATATTAAVQSAPQAATSRMRNRSTTTGGTATETSPAAAAAVADVPLADDAAAASSGPVLAAPEIQPSSPGSAAAEPVAALEPLSESRPVGLLALAATVCLAGVTAAAIRAIVAQRASRTTIA
jgi:hypothetical protein